MNLIKPGWKTTEFWVTVLPIAGVFLLMALGRIDIDDVMRLWPIFAPVAGYNVARGVAKIKGDYLDVDAFLDALVREEE